MKIFPIFRWYVGWFNQPSRPKVRPLSGKPGAAATAACPRWQTLMGLGGKMLEGGIFHGGLIWFNGTIMGYKYISGWWLTYPSENDGVRQLGWWHSQYMAKKMFQTTIQDITDIWFLWFLFLWVTEYKDMATIVAGLQHPHWGLEQTKKNVGK